MRATALTMQEDLKSELGPEVGDLDLRSLHPQTFVKKHLFGDEDDPLGLDFLRKDAADRGLDRSTRPRSGECNAELPVPFDNRADLAQPKPRSTRSNLPTTPHSGTA